MIDVNHFEMDSVDSTSDAFFKVYEIDNSCVLCGKEALPNAMYCYECDTKWNNPKDTNRIIFLEVLK